MLFATTLGIGFLFGITYQQSQDQIVTNLKRASWVGTKTTKSDLGTTTKSANTPVPDGWKTYVNETYGYQISYPPTMSVRDSELSSGVFFGAPDAAGFWIEIHADNVNGATIAEWAASVQWPFPEPWQEAFVSTTLAGLPALHAPVVDGYYFLHESKVYSIENGIGREDKLMIDDQTFSQILTTLKFENMATIDTSQWKIYRNEKYGFKLPLPLSVTAGLPAPASVLTTSEIKVEGLYVGNLVFVVGNSPDRRQVIRERVAYLRQAAEGAFRNDEGPGWGCNTSILTNNQTTIDIFDCGGEGGPAFYALIHGSRYDIFVDGYSSGFNRDLAEQAGHWGSKEDILTSLRTFAWVY